MSYLVLGRRTGESVRVGDAIVSIVRSSSGQVTLGIDAPRNVEIVRCELPPHKQERLEALAREAEGVA